MYILLDTKIRCQKLETHMCSLQSEIPKKMGKVNNLNSKEDSELILKNSTNEETLIFELSTAKNALEDIRVLISKLEKHNDLLINEMNSEEDTIKKLTSQIGN
jgi:hypothetical protein